MATKPLFDKLIVDEFDRPVTVAYVGDEPCYVIDDQGFQRHIPSRDVDLAVLHKIAEMMHGNESLLAELTAKQLGADDIFSRAIIEEKIKNIDSQFEQLLQTGIPEEGKAFLGMVGFKVRINVHGEVIELDQPGIISPDDDEPLD